MNSTSASSSSSLHPVIWIAGIAVTLFSLVGIASLTGLLPSRSATPAEPSTAVATAPAPAAAPTTPAAAPAATTAPVETAAPAAATHPSSAPAPTAHRKTAAKAKAREVAALPPPDAGVPPDYVPPATKPAAPVCAGCGVIADIREVKHEGQGTGLGAVGGGLLGGVVANNIGQGNGRTLATIAGMAGGALLGNKIEKSQRATVSYEVSVRMEDGSHQAINYEHAPSWRVGDPVKVVNGTLVAR